LQNDNAQVYGKLPFEKYSLCNLRSCIWFQIANNLSLNQSKIFRHTLRVLAYGILNRCGNQVPSYWESLCHFWGVLLLYFVSSSCLNRVIGVSLHLNDLKQISVSGNVFGSELPGWDLADDFGSGCFIVRFRPVCQDFRSPRFQRHFINVKLEKIPRYLLTIPNRQKKSL